MTRPQSEVAPGGSTTFTVRFSPTKDGARTAALHIASNDANESPFDIALTGGNQSPVANADTIERFATQGVSVPESVLLANDTDPEGHLPLSIDSVGAAASGQATVSRANGYVFYDPAPGFTGPDSFNYKIADSLGGVSLAATVTVTLKSGTPPADATVIDREPAPGGGTQARLTFIGVPGRTYRVQFSSDLGMQPIVWQTLGTATAGAQGQFQIVDPPPLPPRRFYRAIFP